MMSSSRPSPANAASLSTTKSRARWPLVVATLVGCGLLATLGQLPLSVPGSAPSGNGVEPPVAALATGKQKASKVPPTPPTAPAQRVGYRVLNSYPHDGAAFTQGLLWHDGGFYESTGMEGRSSLRKVAFPSGHVLKKVDVPRPLFAEGLALVGDRLVQLTWQTRLGLIYDLKTLEPLGRFSYHTEGWGITYDGKNLIMSDGSDALIYLDPKTFAPTRYLKITLNGRALRDLNELEWIEGEIWANVWQTDLIVRIDPASGAVKKVLDLKGILPAGQRTGREDVLNGIAYDAAQKRVFVTGKYWPRIFHIEVDQ